jgi:hypothetical protein
VVAAVFGIVSAYVASLRTSLLGTAILLIGVAVFKWTTRNARNDPQRVQDSAAGQPPGEELR